MSLLKDRMTVTQWVLVIRVVNRSVGFGMSFFAVRLAEGGLSTAAVGIVLALFGAATIPSRLLGGALASRYGNRAGAATGLAAAGAAQLVIAAAQAPAAIISAVALLGLAYEVVEPATQAAVVDEADPERLAGQFSLLWAAISLAGVISGLLAAVLSPFGVSALFTADGIGSLAAAVLAWAALPRDRASGRPAAATAWKAVCSLPLMTWTAVFTLYTIQVMIAVFMLPLAITTAHLPGWLPGVVFAASAVGALTYQRFISVPLEQRHTRAHLLALAHLALATGVGLWVLGGTAPYLVGATVEGMAGAALTGTYQAIAARMAPPDAAAKTMAVFGLGWGIAAISAPLLAAPLLAVGPGPLWATVVALSCASAVIAILPGTGRLINSTLRQPQPR